MKEKTVYICFVIHGIGEACDIPMRPIEDCGIFRFFLRSIK